MLHASLSAVLPLQKLIPIEIFFYLFPSSSSIIISIIVISITVYLPYLSLIFSYRPIIVESALINY